MVRSHPAHAAAAAKPRQAAAAPLSSPGTMGRTSESLCENAAREVLEESRAPGDPGRCLVHSLWWEESAAGMSGAEFLDGGGCRSAKNDECKPAPALLF